VNYCLLFSF